VALSRCRVRHRRDPRGNPRCDRSVRQRRPFDQHQPPCPARGERHCGRRQPTGLTVGRTSNVGLSASLTFKQ
jgi:hypothetical protein